VGIDFAPLHRSTALLLAGWLAAQLDWHVEKNGSTDGFRFVDTTGRKVDIDLQECVGEPIGKIALRSRGIEFEVSHPKGADLLEVSRGKPAENRAHQLMPASGSDLVCLMSDELVRGGPHRVYLRASNCVRALL
jgi:hypothetical protein